MKCLNPILVAMLAALAVQSHASAQFLGTADSFAVLGGTTVTNTGPSIVNGDLGVSPGSAVMGFPPGSVVGGTIHAADAVACRPRMMSRPPTTCSPDSPPTRT